MNHARIGLSQLLPADRYRRDPHFAGLVDTVYANMLEPAHYTPTELREAVMLAAIMFEDRRTQMVFYDSQRQVSAVMPPSVTDTERFARHRARTDVDLGWVIEELRLTAQAICDYRQKGRGPDVWLDEMATVIEARVVQQQERDARRPLAGGYVTSRESVHYAKTPFVAVCGSNQPNQATTEVLENVTCRACMIAVPVYERPDPPAVTGGLGASLRPLEPRGHGVVVPPSYPSKDDYIAAITAGRESGIAYDRGKVLVHPSHAALNGVQCSNCMILVTEKGIGDPCCCAPSSPSR